MDSTLEETTTVLRIFYEPSIAKLANFTGYGHEDWGQIPLTEVRLDIDQNLPLNKLCWETISVFALTQLVLNPILGNELFVCCKTAKFFLVWSFGSSKTSSRVFQRKVRCSARGRLWACFPSLAFYKCVSYETIILQLSFIGHCYSAIVCPQA